MGAGILLESVVGYHWCLLTSCCSCASFNAYMEAAEVPLELVLKSQAAGGLYMIQVSKLQMKGTLRMRVDHLPSPQ